MNARGRQPAWVAIAVGLNVPPLTWRYTRALAALARVPGLHPLQATAPLPNAASGPGVRGRFLNGAVATHTHCDPRTLLARLKHTERTLGRRGGGDRPVDYDIIAWCDGPRWRYMRTHNLTLPHPRALRRPFVLLPLAHLTPPQPWPAPWARALQAATAGMDLPPPAKAARLAR